MVVSPDDGEWSSHQRLSTVLAIQKVVRWFFTSGYSDRKIFLKPAKLIRLLPYADSGM
jgi:hypothetical protein